MSDGISRKRALFYGIIGFGVLALVFTAPLVLEGLRQRQSLDAAFAQFSQAVLSKDYSTAYAFGTSAFVQAVDLDSFRAHLESLEKRFGEPVSIEHVNLTIEGRGEPLLWRGRIRARHKYKKGATDILYEFHLVGDAWKLHGLREG